MTNRHIRTTLIAAVVTLSLAAIASACPTCKESLGDSGQTNLVRGYFWSIIFMMSMPFLILGGLSGYFYYEVRKAARQRQQLAVES